VFILGVLVAVCVLTSGCGAPPPDEVVQGDDHEGEEEYEEAVELSPEELEEFGIEVTAAGPALIESYLRLPGEVRPNADRLAHIVPRFTGIVSEVRAQLGDTVQPGDILAIIESDESLYPYELKTLIGGTVIAKHITPGEAVSRGTESYVIADLSSVWVEITVYQRDLMRVRAGQRVFISTSHDPPEASGTISYVTPVVDEATRSATARVVLPNTNKRWRPGMFVNANLLVGSTDAPVAVPGSALHTIDGQSVVFVETEHGFKPRSVEAGRIGKDHVEIMSGLEAGENYVSQGGFTIKAALAEESFGEGHAH
jgi:cobalt-zinc-cadmium efflux system membrane fusion protein